MIHTHTVHTLFLDLASHEQIMAISDETRVLASQRITDHKDERVLLQTLDQLLTSAKIDRTDLHQLACVSGPGGFTTIRVACAFINALQYALDLPSTAIHLSDLMAARVSDKNFLWIHSTRKNQLFIRGFGSFAGTYPTPMLIELDAFADKKLHGASFIGDLLPEHQSLLMGHECIAAKTQELSEILPALLSAQTYGKTPIQPWYGRGI